MPDTVTDDRDRTGHAAQARPQPVTALHGANKLRLGRAAQKRRLATAHDTYAARALAAELVVETPAELVTITVRGLLLACTGVGERVATQLVTRAGLSGGERLGDGTPRHGMLTPRQRRVLAEVLRGGDAGVAEVA